MFATFAALLPVFIAFFTESSTPEILFKSLLGFAGDPNSLEFFTALTTLVMPDELVARTNPAILAPSSLPLMTPEFFKSVSDFFIKSICVSICNSLLFTNFSRLDTPFFPVKIFAGIASFKVFPLFTNELTNALEPGLIIPAFSSCEGLKANLPTETILPWLVGIIPAPFFTTNDANPLAAFFETAPSSPAVTLLSRVLLIFLTGGTLDIISDVTGLLSEIFADSLFMFSTAVEGTLGNSVAASLLVLTSTP